MYIYTYRYSLKKHVYTYMYVTQFDNIKKKKFLFYFYSYSHWERLRFQFIIASNFKIATRLCVYIYRAPLTLDKELLSFNILLFVYMNFFLFYSFVLFCYRMQRLLQRCYKSRWIHFEIQSKNVNIFVCICAYSLCFFCSARHLDGIKKKLGFNKLSEDVKKIHNRVYILYLCVCERV